MMKLRIIGIVIALMAMEPRAVPSLWIPP